MQEVLAPAGIAHQQAKRMLPPVLAHVAFQRTAPAHMHDLRLQVHTPRERGELARRLETALDIFEPRRTSIRIGRLPAARRELARRHGSDVHGPRREHAHVAPRERVRAHFAALEHVHVEAEIEPQQCGFDADGACADDGERIARGERHGACLRRGVCFVLMEP